MAWTAPMTWVSNAVLTAAQLNAHVRDNMMQTAPAKATAMSGLIVSAGTNVVAQRVPQISTVATSETTTSTSWTDLATVGPSVTIVTGSIALVVVSATLSNNTLGNNAAMSYDTGVGADNAAGLAYQAYAGNANHHGSMAKLVVGLTPGSNTFTAKYKVSGGTGTFSNRELSVLAL